MNHFEQGYCDQLRGTLDVLADESSAAGEAYRAGARTCRADLEAAKELAHERTDRSGVAMVDKVPDWERRLAEFRAMISAPAAARVVETTEGLVATEPVRAGQAVYVDDLATTKRANAFAEPDPSAKKPRKAKPADEGQGTFL